MGNCCSSESEDTEKYSLLQSPTWTSGYSALDNQQSITSPPSSSLTPVETRRERMAQPSPSGERGSKSKEAKNMEVFDKVYQKGKVHVFPDFVESKVTLYKKVTPVRPPKPADAVRGPQASREQRTPSTTTKSSAEQTSKVATDSQQQEGRTEATSSRDNLVESSQDKKVGEDSFSAAGDIETSPDGKDGDSSETKSKKRGKKDPYSYVLDEEKLKNPKILEHLESDDCELLVVERIKAALEEIAEPDDPPVFLLHNQNMSSKAASGKSGEKDVLVLHPHLGVLLLEVKAVKNKDAFSRFDEATAQLLHAKESVQKEMGDLLEKDAVVLAIALPLLEPEDSSDIRQKAQERLPTKPASDITTATSTSSMTSSGARCRENRSERKSDTKIKKGVFLGNHPEILLVCGSTPNVFTELVRRLRHLRATASHAFKGSTMEERVESFKKACIRRCSIPGLRPGHSVKESATLHRRFLLTEEQLSVRDSQAQLLHITGPVGSGKTLLLAERARRWLREGRRLALTVGDRIYVSYYKMLLRHLTDSVCGEKTDVARVSIHRTYIYLLQWLPTVATEDPVSVIVDEANFSSLSSSYSKLLDHVTAGRVCGLWSADTSPLSDEHKTKLQSLGGTTVQLSLCLRCPPHVMAFTNSVRGKDELPLLPPPVPVTRELGVEVKVISHPHHRPSQPWDTCPTCKEEGTAIFSSLGLLGQHATSALSLSDVIVITPEYYCDRESVAAWLCGLGLHAVAETVPWRFYDTPVLPPGVAPSPGVQAEIEALRQRVLKGKDVRDRPAVHVVGCEEFQGLERPVVLLWHRDRSDEHRYFQTQRRREDRMSWHRDLWFCAASRCQGRLVVMATTPSPLLSLLPSTSLPKSSTSTASSNSGMKSASPARQPPTTPQSPAAVLEENRTPDPPVRLSSLSVTSNSSDFSQRCTPASYHSPVSSSSLGGESNPRPSSPPEREIIYQRCQTEPEVELGLSSLSVTSNSSDFSQPCTPASYHSPVSSSSLGGESNPRPSSPPEWEIIYQRCQPGPEVELGLSSLSVTSRTSAAPQTSSGGEE